MMRFIKNLFKVAKVLSVVDSGDLRFGTVSMLGKEQKVMVFSPYGLMHNPPENSMALVWSQQGQESNGIAMADDPNNRTIKNLKSGEVGVSNYVTGDYVVFKDGNIIEVSGQTINVSASNVNITCPNNTIIGDVSITGDIDITGDLVATNLEAGGVDYLTHIHEQGQDGAGDNEVDTEPPKAGP